MLPYDTHDKAEGIIQEYSCHVLPIIKYLEITERKLSSLSGRIFVRQSLALNGTKRIQAMPAKTFSLKCYLSERKTNG